MYGNFSQIKACKRKQKKNTSTRIFENADKSIRQTASFAALYSRHMLSNQLGLPKVFSGDASSSCTDLSRGETGGRGAPI